MLRGTDRPAAPVYSGPPSYAGRWPRWGFPPVALRPADFVVAEPEGRAADPRPVLHSVVGLALLTAVLALAAAGAETWRFALLLRGRTRLLPGEQVRFSDSLVVATAWAALIAGCVTAVLLGVGTVRARAEAADRAGWVLPRTAASVVSRMYLPGWNVWGAGSVLLEMDSLLVAATHDQDIGSDRPRQPPRPSAVVAWWWAAWVIDAALAVVALAVAFGSSEQAAGNAVELHIFVDGCAALVAALTAAVAARWRRLVGPGAALVPNGWVVQAPPPTSRRRRRETTQPDSERWAGAGASDDRVTSQETAPASGDEPGAAGTDSGPVTADEAAEITVTSTP